MGLRNEHIERLRQFAMQPRVLGRSEFRWIKKHITFFCSEQITVRQNGHVQIVKEGIWHHHGLLCCNYRIPANIPFQSSDFFTPSPTTPTLQTNAWLVPQNYPWSFLSTVVEDTTLSKKHMRAGERWTLRHRIWEFSGLRIVHLNYPDTLYVISLTFLLHSDFKQTFGYVANCLEM